MSDAETDPVTVAACARLQAYFTRRQKPTVALGHNHQQGTWTLRLFDTDPARQVIRHGPELHAVINDALDAWEDVHEPTTA